MKYCVIFTGFCEICDTLEQAQKKKEYWYKMGYNPIIKEIN